MVVDRMEETRAIARRVVERLDRAIRHLEIRPPNFFGALRALADLIADIKGDVYSRDAFDALSRRINAERTLPIDASNLRMRLVNMRQELETILALPIRLETVRAKVQAIIRLTIAYTRDLRAIACLPPHNRP